MIYYIDPLEGKDTNCGTCMEQPRKNYRILELQPGDTVLFRRGRILRDTLDRVAGTPKQSITYGAYGEGINPVFCGSVNVRQREKWLEISPNIWKYLDDTLPEVGNVIFDHGKGCGTLRWEEPLLRAQGDWFDSCMGMRGEKGAERKFLLYSEGNPADVYRRIECSRAQYILSQNASYTICEDLCFFGGMHGMAMGADHVTVRRCSFAYIGGAVWSRERRIRYGNAVEFWTFGQDIRIEDCYFDNIYDSCITHQGPHGACEPAKNLVMRNNLCMRYGMGAYEARDRMLIDSVFEGNICVDAGGGFGAQGDTVPRNSEIYPQPMGHHVFLWRIDGPENSGSFTVADNVFSGAAGAAIYSIIDPEAEKQMILRGNRYQTGAGALINAFFQQNYREFDSYRSSGREKNPAWGIEDGELEQMVAEWFRRSGAQGPEFCDF